MRKHQDALHDDPSRRRRSRTPSLILFGLFLLVSPLLYEGGLVVVGRWMSLIGSHRDPETPILDAIAECYRTVGFDTRRYYTGVFGNGAWHPSTAVPLALAWAGLMTFMFLRRDR